METHRDQYNVVIAGKAKGPFTLHELRAMSLLPTDFVKPVEHPEFRELQEWPELSRLLHVVYQPTQPQYFATLDVRLLSMAIDYFIALCCYAIMAAIYLAGSSNTREYIPTLVSGLILIPIIKFIFVVAMEGSKRQASIGKILIGIKVTDLNGQPIGYKRALLRNIAKLTGVATLGIGFLAGFADRRQRCWHDKLAGTLVTKDRLV